MGHGASSPGAIQAWMLGDEVYMARVTPTVANIADKTKWEFYAGGLLRRGPFVILPLHSLLYGESV